MKKELKLGIAMGLLVPTVGAVLPMNISAVYAKSSEPISEDDFAKIIDKATDKLEDYSYTNSTSKNDIINVVKSQVKKVTGDKNSCSISVSSMDKEKATTSKKGSIEFTVKIKDNNDSSQSEEIDIEAKIDKVEKTEEDKTDSDHGNDYLIAKPSSKVEQISGSGIHKYGRTIESSNKVIIDKINSILGSNSSSSTNISLNGVGSDIYSNGYYVGTVFNGDQGYSYDLIKRDYSFKYTYVYMKEIDKFVSVNAAKLISVKNETITALETTGQSYFFTNTQLPDSCVVSSGWYELDKNLYYVTSNGIASGWIKDGGSWYFFDQNTKQRTTGWLQSGGKWYYLDINGKMQTGWLQQNGAWYYLDKNGDASIGWKKINNKWYYFNESCVMQTGWLKDNNTWYYLNDDGSMATNTTIDGYTLDKNGALV